MTLYEAENLVLVAACEAWGHDTRNVKLKEAILLVNDKLERYKHAKQRRREWKAKSVGDLTIPELRAFLHKMCEVTPDAAIERPTPIVQHAVSIKPIFAWYDLWIGAFWDRKTRRLYILPFPCIGVVIQIGRR